MSSELASRALAAGIDRARRVLAATSCNDETAARLRAAITGSGLPDLSSACELVVESMAAVTPSPDGLLVSGPSGAAVAQVYAVAALIAAERGEEGAFECQLLVHDAQFMLGRDDAVRGEKRRAERKRKAEGAKGGRPKAYSEEQIRAAVAAFHRRHPGSRRLNLKSIASELSGMTGRPVDEANLSRRLKAIGILA